MIMADTPSLARAGAFTCEDGLRGAAAARTATDVDATDGLRVASGGRSR